MSPDLRQLVQIRWAVRGVLTLGVAASMAANVLHAPANRISETIAAWPPLALLVTIELISRVPVHRRGIAALRWTATAAIASIAAWVSYWHMAAVAARYGEHGTSAYLLPLSVDGLIVVASICLVELNGRLRAMQPAEPEAVPVPEEEVQAETAVTPAESPAPRRTGTANRRRKAARTGTRTDAELLAALADVPRDLDGTIPVRRATAALGCGPDRARRLLISAGLRHSTTSSTPVLVATPVVA